MGFPVQRRVMVAEAPNEAIKLSGLPSTLWLPPVFSSCAVRAAAHPDRV